MTLHWWMHWFWITCHCTFGILLTHSIPLSPMATASSNMDKMRNYTVRKSLQIFTQPTVSKLEASLPVAFAKTSTAPSSSSEVYKTKDTIETTNFLCSNYVMNMTMNLNTTGSKNETRLPCEFNYVNVTDNIYFNESTFRDLNSSTEASTTFDLRFSMNISNKDVISNATFTSVIVPKDSVKSDISDNLNATSTNSLTAGPIAGISLSVLLFGLFVGVASLVLYRRRYINKLQTLNDKCSNPDSSGYIDDTTIRENSEEMYSLDNDSFLNSLEAMTIQNYWTDSVKHTKL